VGHAHNPGIVDASGDYAKSSCDVEFADDYSSNASPNMYAAFSFWGPSSDDDIYSIEGNFDGDPADVTPFDVDPTDGIDFCSLEVDGSLLVAGSFDFGGSSDNAQVWFSENNGITWDMASKNPTGELDYTCTVLISKFGATDGKVFAGTGGEQSAISLSADGQR
jgi:hypothetical protein